MTKTITFYSYKGGVGRSLALSNIATRLSEFGKSVCVLDFDLEAPGLHLKFKKYSRSKTIDLGITDYIHKFACEGIIPGNIRDYSITLEPGNNIFKPIYFIPAGNIDTDEYWKKLSAINWSEMFYSEKGEGVSFFLDLKSKIEKEFNPDFLLIDSRTGITDIAGITLKLLANEIIILAANNEENILGSKRIMKNLLNDNNSLFGAKPKIHFVLTRLPFTDSPQDRIKEFNVIEKTKREFKDTIDLSEFEILVIRSDRRLEENESLLIGDLYEEKGVSISNDYLKLFDAITRDALSKEEVTLFNNKKLAGREFKKSGEEKDSTVKIKYLNNAIELDPNNHEYFYHIGNIYDQQKKWQDAVEYYKKALQLNPKSIIVLYSIGNAYYNDKSYEDALKYVNMAIVESPEFTFTYRLKCVILRKQGKPLEAILEINKAIEIEPESALLLNTRADLNRQLKEFQKAYIDIYKAIEIESDSAIYYGTLAEIYASENKLNEFYSNLSVALSKGIKAIELNTAKDVYEKFKNEERFIALLNKYEIDIEEVLR